MEKLVKLPKKGKAIFVGDTHGDFQASRVVIKNYLKEENYVIFLGDYVDRGPDSKKNIDYLLDIQMNHKNLILLAGNHEMFNVVKCKPANFWKNLTEDETNYYKEKFLQFPLVVSGDEIIGLHGALPEIENMEDINEIKEGDENWYKILWGDFRGKKNYLGDLLGRPEFGKDYFEKIMGKIKKNVLIRSHDPLSPEKMYNNRCLTLFTSAAYERARKIAIVNLEKEITSIDDIEIISF